MGGSTSLWWWRKRRRRRRRRNDDIFVGERGVDMTRVDDTRDLEIFFTFAATSKARPLTRIVETIELMVRKKIGGGGFVGW